MIEGEYEFPLREMCRIHNRTIMGIRSWAFPDADAYNCPPPADPIDANNTSKTGGIAEQLLGDDNADGDVTASIQDQKDHTTADDMVPDTADDMVPDSGGGALSNARPTTNSEINTERVGG